MANLLHPDGGGHEDAYRVALFENENISDYIRVIVVGCSGQGKTTLVRKLLKEDNEIEKSTNDIEIFNGWFHEKKEICSLPKAIGHTSDGNSSTSYKQNKPPENPRSKTLQSEYVRFWDFGGQYVYYNTHQIFMSERAVYLLVFDLSKSLDTQVLDEDFPSKTYTSLKTMEEYIQFWVHSVSTYAGGQDGKDPTIILVGTHLDLLSSEKDADSYFERVRKCIDVSNTAVNVHPENFAIPSIETEETLEQLRNTILKIGRNQIADSCIPENWSLFKQAIMSHRADKIIPFKKAQHIDSTSRNPINDVLEIKRCLNFLHKDGTLLYVDEGELGEFVILDPALLVDAFKAVIFSKRFLTSTSRLRSFRSNLIENAILEEELLSYALAEQMNIDLVQHKCVLIGYLKHFRIVAEAQNFNKDWDITALGYFIVPSLNKKMDNGQIASFMNGKQSTGVSLAYQFESESPVIMLYPKITAGAIGTWPIIRFNGEQLFFENATVYKMNYCHAGLIMKSRGKIELLVISLCPEDDVSPVMSNALRVFVELIIGQELRGCRKVRSNKQATVSFTEVVRCYHQDHSSKGSIDSYDLNMLKMVKSQGGGKICCPDHGSHASLNVGKIFQEWFDYKADERETPAPKTKLTEKDFVTLSTAVGWEWGRLGLELGISDVSIQHIKTDNHTEHMRIFKMFLQWVIQYEDKATFDVLVNALRGLPKYSVNWNIINDLIKRKLE